MGMGHRVYTAGDPRAAILKGMAEEACRQSGQETVNKHLDKVYQKANVRGRAELASRLLDSTF